MVFLMWSSSPNKIDKKTVTYRFLLAILFLLQVLKRPIHSHSAKKVIPHLHHSINTIQNRYRSAHSHSQLSCDVLDALFDVGLRLRIVLLDQHWPDQLVHVRPFIQQLQLLRTKPN